VVSVEVDVKATKIARARHAGGVKRLNKLFAVDERLQLYRAAKRAVQAPIRTHPNTPPVRSPEQRRRRRLRKIVRESRRRNR
jgi:hypothetical protein